jgi:NAD(P)H-hydrate repair Nnr-like enzyme with NAD(P)H-hydrate dehydratase domain
MARAHGASDGDLTEAVAAGVWLHSCAGRLASAPVVATDLVAQVGAAVRVARFGEDIP